MAFFPCTHFCQMSDYNQRSNGDTLKKKGVPVERVWRILKKEADNRHKFYTLALKMTAVVEIRGLRMVVENPWSVVNYTNYHWFNKPSIIDMDRTKRGDRFRKPTAYWFIGCEPTHGATTQQTPKDEVKVVACGGTNTKEYRSKHKGVKPSPSGSGMCNEERSTISPKYAHNFICDFILGEPSGAAPTQSDLFD